MTKTFATQAAPIALAAALTTAMLLATNALADHQFHVAVAAAQQPAATAVALDVQTVVVVGRRANV